MVQCPIQKMLKDSEWIDGTDGRSSDQVGGRRRRRRREGERERGKVRKRKRERERKRTRTRIRKRVWEHRVFLCLR